MVEINHFDWSIRSAQMADAKPLVNLCAQLGYKVDAPGLTHTLKRVMDDERQLALVGVKEDKIIGWIHLFITDRLESGQFAEIGGLVVNENARHKGVGSQLYKSGLHWVKNQDVKKLRVRCASQRAPAQAFYLAQGMKQTKIQHIFDVQVNSNTP